MSKELMKKIIDNLSKIEAKISPEQLRNNKKLTFLLAKKKDYEEIEVFQKECWELVNQETNQAEKKLLQIEIEKLEKVKEQIIEKVKEQIIEKAEVEKNVIMEIRPGTGGIEAGLFVRDLYRMYIKFAKIKKKWKVEEIESEVDNAGNFKFVVFLVKGKKAFEWLKNEAGVHRVQRVPKTENKGRIHTSTASIVVLPEASHHPKILIQDKDIKRETCRSSGAGGQHVNTTDSAVKLTHIPTGIVATSQAGRSQHENERQARLVLESRILAKFQTEKEEKERDLRLSMIGTAARSESIRTYNRPQNRVTDDRLRMSWNKLNFIIEGDLEEICQKLIDYEAEKNLIWLLSQISQPKKQEN